ncbi:MAG: HEAT repeat domain-containing protein [bacterium]
MKTDHIASNQLVLFILDELSAEEKNTTQDHLRTCPECRRILKEENRFFRLMRSQPLLRPEDSMIEKCRLQLKDRLKQKYSRKPLKIFWTDIVESLTYKPAVRRLATVAIVFLFGLVIGRFLPGQRREMGLNVKEAILALSASGQIQDLTITSSEGHPDRIEISFRAVEEKSFKGSLRDPEIQYILSYVLVNETRDNIRLKSVNLLKESHQEEIVKNALMYAVENDRNPGIRLQAIKLLKKIPVNETIKKILIATLFRDDNAGVRMEAVDALAQIDDENIIPILQRRAQEDEYTRSVLLKKEFQNTLPASHEL